MSKKKGVMVFFFATLVVFLLMDGAVGSQSLRSIPVVDLSRIVKGCPTSEDVEAIDEGCRLGFFHVRNHGIPRAVIEEFDAAMRAFFALPEAEKLRYARTRWNSRGFANNEFTKNTRDVKELYDFGHVPDPSKPFDAEENVVMDGYNQVPAPFAGALTAYYDACAEVCARVASCVALALGLEKDALEPIFGEGHTSYLRLNYYPRLPPSAERFVANDQDLDREDRRRDDDAETPLSSLDGRRLGVNRHFDAGGITLLRQDPKVAALQMNLAAHDDDDDATKPRWVDVMPPPPLDDDDFPLTVNVGDMLQVLSNDKYKAAEHRVLATTTDNVRYSAPFFYNPRYDAAIAPLRNNDNEGGKPLYDAFTYGYFRRRRFEGDFENEGKPEIQIAHFKKKLR